MASEPGVPVASVVDALRSPGLGFERVWQIDGTTYKDNSTVIIIPTRGKKPGSDEEPGIPRIVVDAWQHLIAPMNGKRATVFCSGHEVGAAYHTMITQVLAHPQFFDWKYILTLEDDNLPPPDAHIRLLESIEAGHFDAVSGLYFTKGDINMPMAYGDPAEYTRTGALDFRPRDVRECLAAGKVMPVNGIAMGCALWRMDLFREIPAPWFVTLNDVVEGQGIACGTQDLTFCANAVRRGKRFAVDMRVRVGHYDSASNTIY